jgi:hypothetical protein
MHTVDHGGFDGVGIVLNGDGLAGWDFDHCLDAAGNIIDETVAGYLALLDSYSEISPSGTGLRVFLRATLPPKGRKKGPIECYENVRYLTVTGRRLADSRTTINGRQQAVEAVHAAVFGARNGKHQASGASPATGYDDDDAALLERARKAKNGEKFAALYDRGDWGGQGFKSQSEADLTICRTLMFWCGNDSARVDAIFRRSALMRDKWNRNDYRDDTLNKAIATETYKARDAREDRAVDAEAANGDDLDVASTEGDSGTAFEEPAAIGLRTLTLEGLLSLQVPQREPILEPILREQDIAMLYSWRGVGKTHFSLSMAYAIASGGKFLRFSAPRPRPEVPGRASHTAAKPTRIGSFTACRSAVRDAKGSPRARGVV